MVKKIRFIFQNEIAIRVLPFHDTKKKRGKIKSNPDHIKQSQKIIASLNNFIL